MSLLLFFIIHFFSETWARPEKIEVWFLSPSSVSFLSPRPFTPFLWSKRLLAAQVNGVECTPMGEGCFHPQFGLMEMPSALERPAVQPKVEIKNTLDSDLITCDKNYFFDLYCGKAQKKLEEAPAKFQVWFDTSSSFKEVDPVDGGGYCHRLGFAESLRQACPKNSLDIFSYDTSIKELSSLSGLCQSYGLNDEKRLMDWVEKSQAKYLIIVTDRSEYSGRIKDYFDGLGARYKGIDAQGLSAAQMTDTVKNVAKDYCL